MERAQDHHPFLDPRDHVRACELDDIEAEVRGDGLVTHEQRLPESSSPGNRTRPERCRCVRAVASERRGSRCKRSEIARRARCERVGGRCRSRRARRSRLGLSSNRARRRRRLDRVESGSTVVAATSRRSAPAVGPNMERARARVSACERTHGCRDRYQRQIHHDDTHPRHAPGEWTRSTAYREHRNTAVRTARWRDRRDRVRGRGFELPAREYRFVSTPGSGASRCEPGSSRLASNVRRLRAPSEYRCPHSSMARPPRPCSWSRFRASSSRVSIRFDPR